MSRCSGFQEGRCSAPPGRARRCSRSRRSRERGRAPGRFLRLGAEHIFQGSDHIAFLVGVLLLGGSFRQLLGIVTAFTVAHSVTLGPGHARVGGSTAAPHRAAHRPEHRRGRRREPGVAPLPALWRAGGGRHRPPLAAHLRVRAGARLRVCGRAAGRSSSRGRSSPPASSPSTSASSSGSWSSSPWPGRSSAGCAACAGCGRRGMRWASAGVAALGVYWLVQRVLGW